MIQLQLPDVGWIEVAVTVFGIGAIGLWQALTEEAYQILKDRLVRGVKTLFVRNPQGSQRASEEWSIETTEISHVTDITPARARRNTKVKRTVRKLTRPQQRRDG